ncbi:MAG: glycosyltransferase [Candidatus Paceibacterota bacterium]|jgi:glycosyltransferase involved in cell wall biosynthesis
MKVALAHDFLIKWGGAEKVLFDLHEIFPEAPIYTLFYNKKFTDEYFPNTKIEISHLQRKYRLLKRNYRWLLPWMPMAVEALDFSDYDLVVSSSSAFLKGIIVPTKNKHICYMHTPTRWAWQDYFSQKRNFFKRLYAHFYRIWDFDAAQRPDIIIANSEYTARRIKKYYKGEAEVVYPGVELENIKHQVTNKYEIRNTKYETIPKSKYSKFKTENIYQIPYKKYFIVVSRLSAYKKIDLIIEAFKDLSFNLVIVGDGAEQHKLKIKSEKLKINDRVFFTGFIKDKAIIARLVENSIALIHLTEEDFGICMAEALALGKPVIGFKKGGAREIIKRGHNGELIDGKNNEEIINNLKNAVKKLALNKKKYIINITKQNKGMFLKKNFIKEILNLVKATVNT